MKFTFALLFLVLANNAFSQRETGNGGYAHVCRDADKKITSAQLMDLWESEELNTWSSNVPMDDQIKTAMAKIKDISKQVESSVRLYLGQVTKGIVYTKRPLAKTEDAFPPYEPEAGCAYEQVARFENVLTETGKRGLRIYREIYDSPHFSESDKAALIHEAIYLADRQMNKAQTSTRTRILVAHLFSDSKIPNAVRMTFAKLLPATVEWSKDVVKDVQVWATKDNADFRFNFGIDEVDGARYDDDMTAEKRENLYRCTGGDLLNERNIADSGWVPLVTLLSLDNPDAGSYVNGVEVPYYSIEGSYDGSGGKRDLQPGTSISDMLEFSCSKKDKNGVETPVDFSGRYHGIGAECLFISANGSVSVGSGDNCLVFVSSEDRASEKSGLGHIEVVNSQPIE